MGDLEWMVWGYVQRTKRERERSNRETGWALASLKSTMYAVAGSEHRVSWWQVLGMDKDPDEDRETAVHRSLGVVARFKKIFADRAKKKREG